MTFIALILLLSGSTQAQTLTSLKPNQIQPLIQAQDGTITLVNIWASWCEPCKEEFPDMLRLFDNYREEGVRLVLISTDFERFKPDAVAFLKSQNVVFETYIKVGSDAGFIEAFGADWSGALPATFIYNADGELRHHWIGKANYELFEQKTLSVLRAADQIQETK